MELPAKPWFLYLLLCSDGSFYTGITPNLDQRLQEHQSGRGCDFTARRTPVRLIYSEQHPTKSAARIREIEIKKWGRRKKAALAASFHGFPSAR